MIIKSIQKGEGQWAVWYTVGTKYSRIQEELKTVRWGEGTEYKIVVYRVYDTSGNMVAEIESCSSLLLKFFTPDRPIDI
jgi:hypothetical protein